MVIGPQPSSQAAAGTNSANGNMRAIEEDSADKNPHDEDAEEAKALEDNIPACVLVSSVGGLDSAQCNDRSGLGSN